MKAAFNLRGSLAFVGWLAPAYVKGKANPNGITMKISVSQQLTEIFALK